jgi:signal transduction histidine kinase
MISQCLSLSIDQDLMYRMEQLGGPIVFRFEQDTTQIKQKKIVTEDTTIYFTVDRNDFYNHQKILQLQLKLIDPIDITQLDTLFNQMLIEKGIPVKETVIELYDKDKDKTTLSSKLKKNIYWQSYETERVYVDILNSIGIRAYVQTPYFAIFQKMALQLFLSFVLIVAVMISLFRLSRTIFRQRKEEKIKQNFVHTMTHELKRPIATSILILDYLQYQTVKKNLSADESLDSVIFELKKLNSYVEKIQEISQGEEGQIELNKEPVALLPFFRKLQEKYESAGEKEVHLRLQIEKDVSLITDRLHFSNIMENLTENSIKYSGDSVTIEISVSLINKQIRIVHRDNGWGISKSEINHIFEKFYRGVSVEKRRKSGFGLGLSYVQTMMKSLGGEITVSSKENEFTEFILLFNIDQE